MRMIPSTRLLWLLTAWLGVSVVMSALLPVQSGLADFWWMGSALLALLALSDALAGRIGGDVPAVERKIAATLPVGVWREVILRFSHAGRGTLRFRAFDRYPQGCEIEHLPMAISLAPGNFVLARYRLRPDVRGDLHFGRVLLRIQSPFGLWEIVRESGEETVVRSFRLAGYR